MKTFENIALLLRSRRAEVGVSQESFSHSLGYKNGQFVSNVERGLCSIPYKKIPICADLLKIDPEEIIEAIVADTYATLRQEVLAYDNAKLSPDTFAKFRGDGITTSRESNYVSSKENSISTGIETTTQTTH